MSAGLCRSLTAQLLLAVVLLGSSPATAQDAKAGQAFAAKLCARCHAIDKTGASPLPKAPSFPEIASRYSVWSLQEALGEGIVTGHAAMPEFVLNPDEIADLLTFMDTFTPAKGKPK